MKLNILKYEINEEELDRCINDFVNCYQQKPYVFMNQQTKNALLELHIGEMPPYFIEKENRTCKLRKYNYSKCFVDNDLAFGEVEIR